ncbi:MAG: NHL repeat-containing protein [Candidatus Hydrothermia bacterium]
MKRLLITIVLLVFAAGCGYKYPLPPENPGSMPNEEDYIVVRNTNWDFANFNDIQNILVGKDGYIYILEPATLLRYNVNGELVDTFYSGFNHARVLAQDLSRKIYVGDGSRILVFTRDKEFLYDIDFSDTILITGLDVSSSREIYISDSSRSFIVKTDSMGNYIETFAIEGSGILNVKNPMEIFLDEKFGRLIVASTGNNWVEGLSLASPRISLLHLGGITHEGGDTAGVFLYPTDVWADTSGNVYVLDYGNKRIQKFKVSGEFVHAEEFENQPVSLATTKDGLYLYVAFASEVIKLKKPELPQNPGGGK